MYLKQTLTHTFYRSLDIWQIVIELHFFLISYLLLNTGGDDY